MLIIFLPRKNTKIHGIILILFFVFFRVFSCSFVANLSCRKLSDSRAAVEIALLEKSLLVALHTFPANVDDAVVGIEKSVVVVDLAVAFGAPDNRSIDFFRIH